MYYAIMLLLPEVYIEIRLEAAQPLNKGTPSGIPQNLMSPDIKLIILGLSVYLEFL